MNGSVKSSAPLANLQDAERLGHLLLDRGLVTQQEIELVRQQSQATNIEFWRLALSLNLVSAETLNSLVNGTESAAVAGQASAPAHQDQVAIREELADAASVGDLPGLVEQIFERAFDLRATDIHFDPRDDGRLRVRYRIDGQMHDVLMIPAHLAVGIVSRIKVLANMDIIEKRESQDGHIVQKLGHHERNLRLATVPTSHGERLVARILDESQVIVGVEKLGLSRAHIETMTRLLRKPYGILMTVGPVGSGKTTTLYSCLQRLNSPSRNVMTIEDPVEYDLPGVTQLQVDPRADWTFPKALRAILRQDPDIIMVGEVRDDETAKIAVRASLSGNLVLTSMHANDSASAIGALYNYGIPGYLLSNSVLGIVAQRLVRTINQEAYEEFDADDAMRKMLGLTNGEHTGLRLRRGRGTPKDMGTGYLGRTGVFEILEVDDVLRDLIFRETTKDVLRQVAIDMGMTSLTQHAISKVIEGVTTVDEVYRVGLL